jgi:hypothetical protein
VGYAKGHLKLSIRRYGVQKDMDRIVAVDKSVAVDRPVAAGNNTKEVVVIEEGVAVAVVSRLLVEWHEPIQE